MKKTILTFAAGALFLGAACTSTDTSTDTASTAETATTTDATAGTASTTNATDATGTNTSTEATTLTDVNDPTFMMNTASSNLLEIQLGNMAVQNAANAEVKKFGQMMVDHHTKGTQELMTLASQLSTDLPKAMMPMHQEMADKLKGKTGKAFDEDYMDLMETAHKMDIAMFEAKSNNAENESVKAFATKTLPMLRSHLEMATKIEDMVD